MVQSDHVSNHLLASLSTDELAALLPHLKAVELPQETVFFESGDAIKSVYFPHNALISLVVDLACGGIIEAAMTLGALPLKISIRRRLVARAVGTIKSG